MATSSARNLQPLIDNGWFIYFNKKRQWLIQPRPKGGEHDNMDDISYPLQTFDKRKKDYTASLWIQIKGEICNHFQAPASPHWWANNSKPCPSFCQKAIFWLQFTLQAEKLTHSKNKLVQVSLFLTCLLPLWKKQSIRNQSFISVQASDTKLCKLIHSEAEENNTTKHVIQRR